MAQCKNRRLRFSEVFRSLPSSPARLCAHTPFEIPFDQPRAKDSAAIRCSGTLLEHAALLRQADSRSRSASTSGGICENGDRKEGPRSRFLF